MSKLSIHAKGFLLTFIGVLVLTPDTLLIRLANMDVWQMTFWRGCLMSLTIFLALAVIYKKDFFNRIFAIGRTGVVIAILLAINSLTFVLSLEYASVAKVLVIIAIIPMLAALMSIVFLKEHINRGTWIAIVVSIIGIAIVVSDDFLNIDVSDGFLNVVVNGDFLNGNQTNEMWGSLFATLTAIGLAGAFTLTRSKPDINMVPATALNGLMIATCLLPFVWPLQITDAQVGPILTIGLVILPISFGLLALGPRYIPAPEVGLLLLLETCLGPLWVWLVLNEQPPLPVVVGGFIVVLTLASHAIWSLRQKQKIRKQAFAI